MPAFPAGRSAPTFPRVGAAAGRGELEPVTHPTSWYSKWSGKLLGVPARDGGRLAGELLKGLAAEGILAGTHTVSGGEVFSLPAQSIVIRPVDVEDLHAGRGMLECDVCSALVPGAAETVTALQGAPCLSVRCAGRLRAKETAEGFYRRMYRGASMRRVIAREHTGVLDDEVRVAYEDQFKAGGTDPSSPNVLVATPTLEMGIDIGDLSAVYLSSLPRTVASYTQRVGRAGRLNGNALAVTYGRGRGRDLPRVANPLTVIEGQVQPPSTYLSAEEILRRQFTAAIFDSFARDPHRPHPRTAPEVMASVAEHSILGQVIQVAEGKGEVFSQFEGAFAGVGPESFDMLDAWVTALDGPGSSAFALEVAEASARWKAEVEALGYRITELDKAEPELQRQAEAPTATDEDRRALRSAQANLRLARGRRAGLQGKFWIGVLEEAGLLPNYTLLDNTTTLGVGVSQRDPETGQSDTESIEVSRPSALALSEFAPGAKFYTRGLEIEIDAVDLGAEAEEVRRWALCDQCGYGVDTDDAGGVLPASCPRCGSGGIADVGQQVEVVELRRATAEVRRDESAISDRHDDRVAFRFDESLGVDLDPDHCLGLWAERAAGLGWGYYRQATIRRLNLGRAGQGDSLALAGREHSAGLFTVCEGCGKLQRADQRQRGLLSGWQHRPWCQYRTSLETKERKIALSHSLDTQALVLYLPETVALADSYAVPSLMAALSVGFREVLGGEAEHLRIVTAQVPDPQGGGVRPAIVLHDRIPGGTGYLTDWARPDQLHRILAEAWRVVAECECRNDPRQACDKCLLPYAPGRQVPWVSRAAAEKHLGELLRLPESNSEPDPAHWQVEEGAIPAPSSPESVLEHRFRKVLQERLQAVEARVVEHLEQGLPTLTITLPGEASGGRRWSLKSQVDVGRTRPDFVLECTDPNIPRVAIYTDGHQFHATEAHNRLADDAQKRQELRDGAAGAPMGVLSVTMRDVELAGKQEAQEPFIPDQILKRLQAAPALSSTPRAFARQGINPVDWLVRWITAPEIVDIRAAARGIPFAFSAWGAAPRQPLPGEVVMDGVDATERLAETGARLLLAEQDGNTGALSPATSGPVVWLGTGWSAAFQQVPTAHNVTAMALMIDDRAGHLPSADVWRAYLRVANALIFRDQPTLVTTVSLAEAARAARELALKEAEEAVRAGEVTAAGGLAQDGVALALGMPDAWQELVDQAIDGQERQLLTTLALSGIGDLPELGAETEEGLPVDVAWPGQKVALLSPDMTAEERQELEGAGWTVVDPASKTLVAQLNASAVH